MFFQLYTLNISSASDCARKFMSNHHVGLVLFLGIIIGTLCKPSSGQEAQQEK